MRTPDRKTAESIVWHLDGLLSDSRALPLSLSEELGAYRAKLLERCVGAAWARPGNLTPYGRLADTIGGRIADGTWKPGERMPSASYLAKEYCEKKKTVRCALFVLHVRRRLAQGRQSYYVLSKTVWQQEDGTHDAWGTSRDATPRP
jgi:hypothetical protein